ncbi:MAG: FecR domain-containing protein [Butyricimonas faecalis]
MLIQIKVSGKFWRGKTEVFLSGEAYFEVVHDEGHPFVVTTDLGNVRVYGTQFNAALC